MFRFMLITTAIVCYLSSGLALIAAANTQDLHSAMTNNTTAIMAFVSGMSMVIIGIIMRK